MVVYLGDGDGSKNEPYSLQGEGPMGMQADEPPKRKEPPSRRKPSAHPQRRFYSNLGYVYPQ